MDSHNLISYNSYLLDLLNNNQINPQFDNEFKLNIYLTLLSLNNSNYHESIYLEEINILEEFLRKTNNMKVKIQLKRKANEIDNLLSNIKEIYNNNQIVINRYNKNNLDITNILESKNANDITTLIDKLTKEKMLSLENKGQDDIKRDLISYNIFKNNYYLKEDTLYIEQDNSEPITITLPEFYRIFEYLLYLKNYPPTYTNDNIKQSHLSIITDIINTINTNQLNEKVLIPIVLTYIVLKDIPNYNLITTNTFNIQNIKITDLYSLAGNQNINENTAKWKNIYISNDYLYHQIKDLTIKGNYYYDENNFVLDNINNFKTTITIDNMKLFLKSNLENLIK